MIKISNNDIANHDGFGAALKKAREIHLQREGECTRFVIYQVPGGEEDPPRISAASEDFFYADTGLNREGEVLAEVHFE